ncbi:hypothetical protein CQ12_39630 [Bradyrhizobium jicamae]|uniref:Uncharacterized protein n=1 Tax=Bradyrhizobium jicamae TaxID=280332 RepID=A0A0R3M3C9_9BRAD|nr:hypothetical protein CQ12_39630 [Bradyrhizobium jicamae]
MSSCHFPRFRSHAIPIASRTDDGRDATSRPSGGDADDGDGEEDATAVPAVVPVAVQAVFPVAVQATVQPAIQAAPCQGLEPPA